MGKYLGMGYKDLGYTMSLRLKQFTDKSCYENVYALCTYRYNKKKEKYTVDMYLYDRQFGVSIYVKTGTLRCDRKEIRPFICRLVSTMTRLDYFSSAMEHLSECRNVHQHTVNGSDKAAITQSQDGNCNV